MKYNVILLMMFLLAFAGCRQQDVDMPFEARDGLYFASQSTGSDFQPLDSVSVSFGLRPEEIRFDTIRVKVTFIGRTSKEVRKYKVKVIEKSSKYETYTDMQEGIHYLPLKSEYEFAPDSFDATLELIIDRSHFSSSFQRAEEHKIVLQLEESENFYIGIGVAQELVVKVNNYMAKPIWWELEGFSAMEKKLTFYHPEKWKELIYVDEGFANPDELPFDKNNGLLMNIMIERAKGLKPWWPKTDEETGDLVYFDKIITVNN